MHGQARRVRLGGGNEVDGQTFVLYNSGVIVTLLKVISICNTIIHEEHCRYTDLYNPI